MAPWWRHRSREEKVCVRCKGVDDVHRGLCRHCRALLLTEETPGGAPASIPDHDDAVPSPPDIEPAHDRPWIHRGGG